MRVAPVGNGKRPVSGVASATPDSVGSRHEVLSFGATPREVVTVGRPRARPQSCSSHQVFWSETNMSLGPGKNCWRIERAERLAWLVDGAAYYPAFHNVVSRAEASILLLGWD